MTFKNFYLEGLVADFSKYPTGASVKLIKDLKALEPERWNFAVPPSVGSIGKILARRQSDGRAEALVKFKGHATPVSVDLTAIQVT